MDGNRLSQVGFQFDFIHGKQSMKSNINETFENGRNT